MFLDKQKANIRELDKKADEEIIRQEEEKGMNKVELKFDHPNGCGTWASLKLNGFKMKFGGGVNHVWMVVNE